MTDKEIIFSVSLDELRKTGTTLLNRVNAIVGFITMSKEHVVAIETETFSVKFHFDHSKPAICVEMKFKDEQVRALEIFQNHRTNNFNELEDFLFFIRNADIEDLDTFQFDAWYTRHAWSKV